MVIYRTRKTEPMKLAADERGILESSQQGQWRSVKEVAGKKKFADCAAATYRKDLRVNI